MKLRYLAGVSTLSYDKNKCRNCGRCVEVCPHGVFTIENNQARIIRKDSCIECGACQLNCQFGAISVRAGVGCATAMLNAKPNQECSCDGNCCG